MDPVTNPTRHLEFKPPVTSRDFSRSFLRNSPVKVCLEGFMGLDSWQALAVRLGPLREGFKLVTY